MRNWIALMIALAMTATACPAELPARTRPQPVRVIFDTDMWGDVDDVLALAMLHNLQDRGEAEILAVTSSTSDPWCASFIDLVDHFYGRGNIPIGLVRGGVVGHPEWMGPLKGQPNYTQAIATMRGEDGALRFPHDLVDGSRAPEAVALLRKTLAAQPDGSVVIIQVGFATNLARLLSSKPDAFSPLSGSQLVKRKVKLLSAMAGQFEPFTFEGVRYQNIPEFNLKFDVPSAQRLFAAWPTPIVASGYEVGVWMLIDGATVERNYGYTDHHPVLEAYRAVDPIYRLPKIPKGVLHNHATFDLTSVLYAVRPNDGYFNLSTRGTISVAGDGSTRFSPAPNGQHRYLRMTAVQRARALEAMTLLASGPPTQLFARPAH